MTLKKVIFSALIPIRSGSKSISDKNIKLFCGKPLFYWSAKAAVDSGIFNGGVYVAVDCQRYYDIVKDSLCDVTPIMRPDYTATDTASSESVMEWFVDNYKCDVVSLIQATTPTVTKDDFINAYALFNEKNADSLLTAVKFMRFFWRDNCTPFNYDPQKRPRRQEMKDQFLENGSFYFTKKNLLKQTSSRLGGKIVIYTMNENTMIEIDEPSDWEKAEKEFLKLTKNKTDFKNIRVIIIDVDGTLTDGGMYYGSNGESLKKFNTRDGAAISELIKAGYRVCVCTGENSDAVTSRMMKLGITDYLFGVNNKVKELSQWLKNNCFDWSQVLYVGDELNDKEAMLISAYSVCPADAHPSILDIASYITKSKGGEGVIRDLVLLMEVNQQI